MCAQLILFIEMHKRIVDTAEVVFVKRTCHFMSLTCKTPTKKKVEFANCRGY